MKFFTTIKICNRCSDSLVWFFKQRDVWTSIYNTYNILHLVISLKKFVIEHNCLVVGMWI
jgi:hypothetical protein